MTESIATLAHDVASALGAGWTVEHDEELAWSAYLNGPESARVFIRRDWKPSGKVMAHGTYPRGFEPRTRYGAEPVKDEIGVSESRGAAIIAREIINRLLPAYLPALRESFKSQDDSGNAAKARAELGEELAGIVGGTYDADDRSSQGRVRLPMTGAWGHVDVMYRADSCTVELHSVSPDLARVILRAVAGHKG